MIEGTAHDANAMFPVRLARLHRWFDCAENAQEHLGEGARVTLAGKLIDHKS